jgi:hypothetical protein
MGQVVRSRLPVCRAMHGNGRYVKLERKYRFLPRSGTKYFFPPLAGGWRFEGRRRRRAEADASCSPGPGAFRVALEPCCDSGSR